MAVGKFHLEESAAHFFDQHQSELLSAIRKEKKGIFVHCLGQDVFGFSVIGDVDELRQFLKDVSASAQSELTLVNDAAGD